MRVAAMYNMSMVSIEEMRLEGRKNYIKSFLSRSVSA